MVNNRIRIIAVFLLFVAVCAVFFVRMGSLQLSQGEDYLKKSQNSVVTKTTVKAARGAILDRYCRTIASSTEAMTVQFNKTLISDLNATVARVIDIFEAAGEEYIDTFPITETEPYIYKISYLESASAVASFNKFLSARKIATDMSAADTLKALIKYYKLTSYDFAVAAKVAAVRYEMDIRSSASFFTFATDVGIEAATMIKENSDEIPGVYIEVEPVRVYSNEYFASHVIGHLGRIYAEEYETLKNSGYTVDDYIGKEGIEKIAEEYLRGTNGVRYAVRDVTGSVVEIIENEDSVSPKAGYDVITTLDTDMQIITEESLEKIIYKIRELNGEDSASSGAAIFMDIDTAEILSTASWPTFNIATYNKDFATLSQDPSSPYVNRAISGLFMPGSTFKMVTAVAGLEEGLITPQTIYTCTGKYNYYENYSYACYASTAHGAMDVKTALAKSCNVFFFDLGRRLTIDKLSSYGAKFGFGSKTGIDLLGENAGTLASREYRENILGGMWQLGDTLIAAIGQTDNTATPLQLVNYVATIANGGTRRVPHVIKSVMDSETGEVIKETVPEVAEELDISPETVATVLEGMRMAAEKGGTVYNGFKDFDIPVAVKTGTAEKSGEIPTSLMVGVAPANDPKVAFVVVIENGGLNVSSLNAELVKDVLSYYFSDKADPDRINAMSELLD
ncbi:MAG: penicillin-binding transpeptidase domain-containing protein [Eubacteriales bacterium]